MLSTMKMVDSTYYRQTVGNYPSGVTVVTARDTETGADLGLTVSAFTSLSLEPPMVLLSIDARSKSHPHLMVGAPIGVSVLAEDQLHLAVQFARHGLDRFAGVNIVRRSSHHDNSTSIDSRDDVGVPLIGGAAAWFLGTVTDRYVGGWEEETRPLIYQRGKLHHWPDELG